MNKILIIGNLGRDPEMRCTPGGQGVTSFSGASSRRTLTWWHGTIRSGEINGEEQEKWINWTGG